MNPLFSLVIATVDRTQPLVTLLNSLLKQSNRVFEIILVDQNTDGRLAPVLEPFAGKLTIKVVPSARGLSRARNVGLPHCRGQIIAFPDDDCWYPMDLLERVWQHFEKHPNHVGLTGRVAFDGGADHARFDATAGPVTHWNVWKRTCSFTLFVRKNIVDQINGFDEELGIGTESPWKGGEDIDFAVATMACGRLYYDPQLNVHHPALQIDQSKLLERTRQYGRGIGRVWRKQRFPKTYVFYYLLRPLVGWALGWLTLRPGKAKVHAQSVIGRYEGWRSSIS